MRTNQEPKFTEFVRAQDAVYDQVRRELAAGRKRSHWIWFIFPQLVGLGFSAMSRRFGIISLDEARSYLAHPVLGARLRECVELVLAVEGREIDEILGYPDDLKFRSCLTLFAAVDPDRSAGGLFRRTLARFYGGQPDDRTLDLLGVKWGE